MLCLVTESIPLSVPMPSKVNSKELGTGPTPVAGCPSESVDTLCVRVIFMGEEKGRPGTPPLP